MPAGINWAAYKLRIRDWVEMNLGKQQEQNREEKTLSIEWFIGIVRCLCGTFLGFRHKHPAIPDSHLNGNSKRHDDKLLFSSEKESEKPTPRLSLWVVIKVCQMCHRNYLLQSGEAFHPTDSPRNGNNYWNIPIANKDSRSKGRHRNLRPGLWGLNCAEIRFSVVCARWRMKISDELWTNPLIACLLHLVSVRPGLLQTVTSPFASAVGERFVRTFVTRFVYR